ncbi:MAG: hypothetical protein JWM90_342 [Thermoleophilia bacterium]|nr:hypothetical protein [Thermoleophilia bacterium]
MLRRSGQSVAAWGGRGIAGGTGVALGSTPCARVFMRCETAHDSGMSDTAPQATPHTTPDPHPTWSEPEAHFLQRIVPSFVLTSWLLSLLATAVLATGILLILSAVSDAPLTSTENASLGVSSIAAAFATFIGFVLVQIARLPKVAHDRLVNSLAVAALHVSVAFLILIAELIARGSGWDPASGFGGTWTDQLGNAFIVLERSAVAAIAACLLAVGMVPARGERPVGTQTDPTIQDRQL